MTMKRVWTVVLASIAMGIGITDADAETRNAQQLAEGERTYLTYCALCHGAGGGPGMFAGELKKAAPDLTTIAKRNGGAFPASRVDHIIRDGGIGGHGTMRLLSWERYFKTDTPEERADEIVDDLVQYLEAHQVR